MAEYDGEIVINTKINSDSATAGTEELIKAMKELSNIVTTVGQTLAEVLGNIAQNLQYLTEFTVGFAEGLSEGLAEGAQNAQEMQNATSSATTSIIRQESATNGLNNAFKKLGDLAKKGLKSCVNVMARLAGYTRQTSENATNTALQFIKASLGVQGIQALFNKLRGAIQYGSKNLAQYAQSYNDAISSVMNGLNQLKNNIAAAFQPLVEYVLPILDRFIDGLNGVVEKMSEFISALMGKDTYTKAVKQAEKYAKQAEKNGLNKLEELDVLKKNDEIDGSNMFTTAQVSNSVKELAEVWRTLFVNGDYETLGNIIGNGLATALNNIPWDEIKAKSQQFGKDLASFFNGFISPELFSAIGTSIAQYINTKANFVNGFLHQFSFEKLGQSIVTGVKNTLEGINWRTIRDNALTGFRGLATTLNQIVQDQQFWDDVGHTFAQSFMTVIDGWYGFVSTFDFKSFGTGMGEAINKFFDEMDWEEFGKAISDSVIGILETIEGLITTADWGGMAQAIVTVISNINWLKLLDTFVSIAKGIVKALATAITTLVGDSRVGLALAGVLTSVVALNAISGAGATMGASLLGGIAVKLGIATGAALAGFELGKWLGKLFFPGNNTLYDDFKLQNAVDAFSLFAENVKNNVTPESTGMVALFEYIVGIENELKGFADYLATNWAIEYMKNNTPNKSYSGGVDVSLGPAGSTTGFDIWDWIYKKVFGFADGGVIPRTSGEFIAKLGDNKRETEIVSPLSTMKQAMTEAMEEMGYNSNNGSAQQINLSIDGNKLFTWIVDKNKNNYINTSRNQLVY